MNRCVFRTLHEYRDVLGLFGLFGLMTGLVDALVIDWSVKAFLWSGLTLLLLIIASYELTVMEAPERPLLQSILLVSAGVAGFLSTHHFAWFTASLLVGREIESTLWLAPNIYADTSLYTVVMVFFEVAYLVYMLYANACSAD